MNRRQFLTKWPGQIWLSRVRRTKGVFSPTWRKRLEIFVMRHNSLANGLSWPRYSIVFSGLRYGKTPEMSSLPAAKNGLTCGNRIFHYTVKCRKMLVEIRSNLFPMNFQPTRQPWFDFDQGVWNLFYWILLLFTDFVVWDLCGGFIVEILISLHLQRTVPGGGGAL